MDDVTGDVVAIIAKKLPPDKSAKLQLTRPARRAGPSTVAAVEMIFDLEEKFDIQIPYNSNDSRLEFETVGEIADAIKKRLGQS